MFAKSSPAATQSAPKPPSERSRNQVAQQSMWKELLEKESKAAAQQPTRPYAVNPNTMVLLPEKPNHVPFESRCRPGVPIMRDPFSVPAQDTKPAKSSAHNADSSKESATAEVKGMRLHLHSCHIYAVGLAGSFLSVQYPMLSAITLLPLSLYLVYVDAMLNTMKMAMASPAEKYPFPMTTSQEYGWFEKPLTNFETLPEQGGFHRGLKSRYDHVVCCCCSSRRSSVLIVPNVVLHSVL